MPGASGLRRRDCVVLGWWMLRACRRRARRGSLPDLATLALIVVAVLVVLVGAMRLHWALLVLYGPIAAISVVVAAPVVMAALALGAFPGTQLVLLCRPSMRWYGSVAEQAVLSITATTDQGVPRWDVGNHLSSLEEKGKGRELRDRIGPPLLAAADAQGVTITCTTRSPVLAKAYLRALRGSRVVGRGCHRYRLERKPR